MFKVGDKVEYIKTRRNARDWYGTVVEVDEKGQRLNVEWVVKGTETKLQWNPMSKHKVVDAIPNKERRSKKRFKEIKYDLNPDWRQSAKCLGTDVNLFVDYGTPRPDDARRKELEAICDGCGVQVACRVVALKTNSVGWWGNMDDPDRVKWGFDVLSGEVVI